MAEPEGTRSCHTLWIPRGDGLLQQRKTVKCSRGSQKGGSVHVSGFMGTRDSSCLLIYIAVHRTVSSLGSTVTQTFGFSSYQIMHAKLSYMCHSHPTPAKKALMIIATLEYMLLSIATRINSSKAPAYLTSTCFPSDASGRRTPGHHDF